jgi:hypothetical protein
MDALDEIARYGGIIAGLAAGVAGTGYLIKRGGRGFKLLARAGRALTKLAAIGDAESWPNGSTDPLTFLKVLHDFAKSTHDLLTRHLEDHEHTRQEYQDDETDRARGTGDWDPPEGTPA